MTTTQRYYVFRAWLNPSLWSWSTLFSPPKIDVHFCRRPEVRSPAHAYLTGTLRALDCAPLEVGGVAESVHILCGLSRKISLSELVKNLKTISSKILKGKVHDGFSWQNGYGAFSVSQSAGKSVFSYIADQEIHHRRMTFQEEFRALLNKHEIRFDERYVWD